MFSRLHAVGGILQFIGVLTPFVGMVAGFVAASNVRFGATGVILTYTIAGVISGAVTYGLGGLIWAQVSIARDARRAANALERLVYRQSQQANTSSRVRQLGQNE